MIILVCLRKMESNGGQLSILHEFNSTKTKKRHTATAGGGGKTVRPSGSHPHLDPSLKSSDQLSAVSFGQKRKLLGRVPQQKC